MDTPTTPTPPAPPASTPTPAPDQSQISKRSIITGVVILFIVAVILYLNAGQGPLQVASTDRECADAIDNDGDLLKDQTDPACWNDPRDSRTYNDKHPEEKVASSRLSFELPAHVAKGEQAALVWQAANVLAGTCIVRGKNGDGPWEQDNGEEMSSPLTEPTIFTLRCNDLKNDLVVEQKVVNVE